jgi:hypothetical protein
MSEDISIYAEIVRFSVLPHPVMFLDSRGYVGVDLGVLT